MYILGAAEDATVVRFRKRKCAIGSNKGIKAKISSSARSGLYRIVCANAYNCY